MLVIEDLRWGADGNVMLHSRNEIYGCDQCNYKSTHKESWIDHKQVLYHEKDSLHWNVMILGYRLKVRDIDSTNARTKQLKQSLGHCICIYVFVYLIPDLSVLTDWLTQSILMLDVELSETQSEKLKTQSSWLDLPLPQPLIMFRHNQTPRIPNFSCCCCSSCLSQKASHGDISTPSVVSSIRWCQNDWKKF